MKFTKNYIDNIKCNYEAGKDCFNEILLADRFIDKVKYMAVLAIVTAIVLPLVILGLEPKG